MLEEHLLENEAEWTRKAETIERKTSLNWPEASKATIILTFSEFHVT